MLEALQGRTLRFNELMRSIGDISKQMLSRTLRRPEQDGFMLRTIYVQIPPRVEYTLNDLGRSFLEPLGKLVLRAEVHHKEIVLSRRDHHG